MPGKLTSAAEMLAESEGNLEGRWRRMVTLSYSFEVSCSNSGLFHPLSFPQETRAARAWRSYFQVGEMHENKQMDLDGARDGL